MQISVPAAYPIGGAVVVGGCAYGIRHLIRIKRCWSVGRSVESTIPKTYNCTWPQRHGSEVWCNDLFMHCVMMCRLTSLFGGWMANWCADYRSDDSEERVADSHGIWYGMTRRNMSVTDCAVACQNSLSPTEPGVGYER